MGREYGGRLGGDEGGLSARLARVENASSFFFPLLVMLFFFRLFFFLS